MRHDVVFSNFCLLIGVVKIAHLLLCPPQDAFGGVSLISLAGSYTITAPLKLAGCNNPLYISKTTLSNVFSLGL